MREDGELRGTRVAGPGEVVGRVHVMSTPDEVKNLQRGAIVVG